MGLGDFFTGLGSFAEAATPGIGKGIDNYRSGHKEMGDRLDACGPSPDRVERVRRQEEARLFGADSGLNRPFIVAVRLRDEVYQAGRCL